MGETIQNPGSKLAQIVFCCSHTCNDACQLFEFVSQTDVCQNKGARRSTLNSELCTRMRRAARRAARTSWRAAGAWGTTSRWPTCRSTRGAAANDRLSEVRCSDDARLYDSQFGVCHACTTSQLVQGPNRQRWRCRSCHMIGSSSVRLAIRHILQKDPAHRQLHRLELKQRHAADHCATSFRTVCTLVPRYYASLLTTETPIKEIQKQVRLYQIILAFSSDHLTNEFCRHTHIPALLVTS